MTLRRITNFKNRKKAKAQKGKSNFLLLNNDAFKFVREDELKEKYRYSKDDLEHLFV